MKPKNDSKNSKQIKFWEKFATISSIFKLLEEKTGSGKISKTCEPRQNCSKSVERMSHPLLWTTNGGKRNLLNKESNPGSPPKFVASG